MSLSLNYAFKTGYRIIQKKIPYRLFASKSRNPYDVLGVKRDAPNSEIKKAYFELAKKYHPDSTRESNASQKFVEIQEAYDILSDPEKRAAFDNYGREYSSNDEMNNEFSSETFNPTDLFGELFKNYDPFFSRNIHETKRQFDKDIYISIELEFLEAVLGTKKHVVLERKIECSNCNGTGFKKEQKKNQCKTCRGSGRVTSIKTGFFFSTTCPSCGGIGKQLATCDECKGNGFNSQFSEESISIPAGIENNSIFNIPGLGNSFGNKKGDLNIKVHIKSHDKFTRSGDDINSVEIISLKIALCGGICTVQTIHGPIDILIKGHVQSDEMRRLSGRGIFNHITKNNGNHYVKFKVEIPKLNTDEQIQISKILDKLKVNTEKEQYPDSNSKESKWFGKFFSKLIARFRAFFD